MPLKKHLTFWIAPPPHKPQRALYNFLLHSFWISHKTQCWFLALKLDNAFLRPDVETHTFYQRQNLHTIHINALRLYVVQD
jgi:hypothetical protein